MKRKMILPAILAVALILGIAWFLHEPEAPKGGPALRQPAYRMQVEGLRFYGMNRGRRVISIAADRFTLRKGKIAFFSTGLTRTALIENAVIEIYAAAPSLREASPQGRSAMAHDGGDSAKQGHGGISGAGRIDFSGLFSEETFSSLLPVRSMSQIEISSVTVRLHGERGVLTQITAAGASLRFKEREVLFTGNVRVSASGAELATEQLSFLPETARLRTERPFALKKGNRSIEGTGFETDIFLAAFPPSISVSGGGNNPQ